MISKRILPEGFNFDVPSVELIGVGSKGLDKTAMVKRASAFDDVLDKIEKKANRTYLHVITTGAFEKYGANANCFPADTPVVTPNGVKNIQDICEGDTIIAGSGRSKKVLKTMNRQYSGTMYCLKVQGMQEPVSMTAEHPVKVLHSDVAEALVSHRPKPSGARDEYIRQITEYRKQAREAIESASFVEAHDISVADYVLIPRNPPHLFADIFRAAEYVRRGADDSFVVGYIGNYMCVRILDIVEEQVEDVTVYNIEVEDEHTYCVPFVVHNCDAWNGESFEMDIPMPEDGKTTSIKLDGGLSKYHDDTYMKNGAVYQEHQTKRAGVDPSGEVVAAKYNPMMKRGELVIAVDTNKWASRLQKKASGKDIYLSIGCDVPKDTCVVCGRVAKTASQHCEHFTKHRGQLYDCGKVACVMNDTQSFYDISGVDVPADRIAFVLQKVASGANAKEASLDALLALGSRTPMLLTKSARILTKLSNMEKQIQCHLAGDHDEDIEEVFKDSDDAKKDFILKVENYPSDEVIDSCNRKGILLSPEMLFHILGGDCDECSKHLLQSCDDSSCGDMSSMMQEMEEDEERNSSLLDGSFDQHLPADLNLDSILEAFMPEFGATKPAINAKIIKITISGRKPKDPQQKEASFNKIAQDALRRTYARYLISFAEQNDDATCMNALRKIARYGK